MEDLIQPAHSYNPGKLRVHLSLLTNWDGGDLSVDIQHAVAVHIHQVVPPALLIVTEEVDCTNILGRDRLCIKDSTLENRILQTIILRV